MKPNWERHDVLLRQYIERNEGYIFKTVDDAYCAAFPIALQGMKVPSAVGVGATQFDDITLLAVMHR